MTYPQTADLERELTPVVTREILAVYEEQGINEVFSTDWSFGVGQDKRCLGDRADPLGAQADAAERLPSGLEQRDPAFAQGTQAAAVADEQRRWLEAWRRDRVNGLPPHFWAGLQIVFGLGYR